MRDAVCIADIISEFTNSNLYWGVCVQGCQSPRNGTGFMDFGSGFDTKLYRTDYLSDCPYKIFSAPLCKMRCSSGGGLFGMSAVRNQSAGKLSILRQNRAAGMECLCTLWYSPVTVRIELITRSSTLCSVLIDKHILGGRKMFELINVNLWSHCCKLFKICSAFCISFL